MRLSEEQIKHFNENGYVKISGIWSEEEFETISDEYNRLFNKNQNEGLEAAWAGEAISDLAKNKDYSVQSIHNLQYHSAVFSQILHNESLLEALEDAMGTPNFVLHHTKAHLKPPGKGAPFPMHQDYHYFPFKKHTMCAVFVHMDDTSPENGGLCVYPGSHKLGPLEDFGTYVEAKKKAFHYVDPKKYPVSGATPVHAKRGDVVVFSYLLLHGSYENLSDRVRRMFLIQVRDADDEPLQDVHKSPGYGWVLRGRNDNRSGKFSDRY